VLPLDQLRQLNCLFVIVRIKKHGKDEFTWTYSRRCAGNSQHNAPALNLENRDVAEAAEAYLARLLNNPAVQDFIANLDDDSETVEVSKRGLIDLAGHSIAGAANLGGNVVKTGAGFVGGLAKTGVELLENLFGSGANFSRNFVLTG